MRFLSVDNNDWGVHRSRAFIGSIGPLWPIRVIAQANGWVGRDPEGYTFWMDATIEIGPVALGWQTGRNPRRGERFTVGPSLDIGTWHRNWWWYR